MWYWRFNNQIWITFVIKPVNGARWSWTCRPRFGRRWNLNWFKLINLDLIQTPLIHNQYYLCWNGICIIWRIRIKDWRTWLDFISRYCEHIFRLETPFDIIYIIYLHESPIYSCDQSTCVLHTFITTDKSTDQSVIFDHREWEITLQYESIQKNVVRWYTKIKWCNSRERHRFEENTKWVSFGFINWTFVIVLHWDSCLEWRHWTSDEAEG